MQGTEVAEPQIRFCSATWQEASQGKRDLGKKGTRHTICRSDQSVIGNLNERVRLFGQGW